MDGIQAGGCAGGATGWISLAAAPTFAAMALLTGVLDAGRQGAICAVAPAGLPLNDMVAMYLLMSAFHTAPWIRLFTRRESGSHGH